MSALVGDGGPLTANGEVNGSQLGTYQVPALGTFRVESVVAQIDATAAPAVQPILRVLDKSGAVIATKRQGESVPAGDTGSATWALRLADEAKAASVGEKPYFWGAGDPFTNVAPGVSLIPLLATGTNDAATYQVNLSGDLEIHAAGTYLASSGLAARSSVAHPVAAFRTVTCVGNMILPVAWTQAAVPNVNSASYGIGTGPTIASWLASEAVVLLVPPAGIGQAITLQFSNVTGVQLSLPVSSLLVQKLSDQFV